MKADTSDYMVLDFDQIDYANYQKNYDIVKAMILKGDPIICSNGEKLIPVIPKGKKTAKREPEVLPKQMDIVSKHMDTDGHFQNENVMPVIMDMVPSEKLPYAHDKEARLFGAFCSEIMQRLETCDSKVAEWDRITDEYNAGKLLPELYQMKGKRTGRCLRLWLDIYVDNDFDMYALLHKRKNEIRGRKVTIAEQNYLLNLLLTPKQVKIGSAISLLKRMDDLKLVESPSSTKTLKRWIIDWRTNHPAEWAQATKGSKYVAEHIVKSIMRDANLLSVGNVWVADGHTLAFDIYNPVTGKTQRMTLILIIDWASRYPVGAALAVTEDSQHICAAFRNGFLNWGALPEYVYLDNGKAFRSKLFNEKWEDHDLSVELGGIFPRLGIGVSFAQKYNARSKIIERFFLTMQEQFERFISTFRGASVADKPATLMRNEVWAKKLYEGTAPTVEETMQMITFYIRHIYGETPHSGIGNRKPYEVFSQAALPEERIITADKLNFLMLSAERKRVRSEGIRLNHMLYWHDALVDHIGKPVVIRYDHADARWILIFTQQDQFICQAELRRAQHPFIHLVKDDPIAHKELSREYNQIKKLQRKTEQKTKQIVKQTQEAVDRLVKPIPVQLLESDGKLFNKTPMLTAPIDNLDIVASHVYEQILPRVEEPPRIITNPFPQYVDSSLENDDDEPVLKQKTFAEMMKIVGIK
jgi:putative transposase